MHAQKTDVVDILARARRLGKRTMVGDRMPAVSRRPCSLLPIMWLLVSQTRCSVELRQIWRPVLPDGSM